MKAISLDIETLDTSTSSVVLSIGAVVVTADGVDPTRTFYKRLAIQEQINAQRTISESTLRFWMAQHADVRENTWGSAVHGTLGQPVRFVLESLKDWVRDQGRSSVPVYVKGPQFDAAIIDDLADTFAVERPIHYRQWRDVRTVEDVLRMSGHGDTLAMKQDARPTTMAHDALADAVMQGDAISLLLRLLRDRANEEPEAGASE